MSEPIPRLDGKGFHQRPRPAGQPLPAVARKRWRVPRGVLAGALILLLAGAIGTLGWFAQRAATAQRTSERMQQIVSGMHNFQAQHGRLPGRANFDDSGQPLLSWRVHLLPLVGQKELHEQFHLDEPWDSEHNRTLIAKIPLIYRTPGASVEAGKTCFVVPVADHVRCRNRLMSEAKEEEVFDDWGPTVFPLAAPDELRKSPEYHRWSRLGEKLEVFNTQRAVVLLQVEPKRAVVWTRPDDFEVSPQDTALRLADIGFGNFLAVTANGTVHQWPKDMSQEILLSVLARGKYYLGRLPDEPEPAAKKRSW